MLSDISGSASKIHVFISKLVQQTVKTSALRRGLCAQFSSTMSFFALDRAVVLKECEPR